MDPETRAYLDQLGQGFGDLRAEVGALRERVDALAGLPVEVAELRERVHALAGLPAEVAALREDLGTVRHEVRTTAEETRRHFDVIAEGLRADIRLVAEATVANT